jgi:hypothetical protein
MRRATGELLANYAAVFVQLCIAAKTLEQTCEESMVDRYPPNRALEWLECGGGREEELWFEKKDPSSRGKWSVFVVNQAEVRRDKGELNREPQRWQKERSRLKAVWKKTEVGFQLQAGLQLKARGSVRATQVAGLGLEGDWRRVSSSSSRRRRELWNVSNMIMKSRCSLCKRRAKDIQKGREAEPRAKGLLSVDSPSEINEEACTHLDSFPVLAPCTWLGN